MSYLIYLLKLLAFHCCQFQDILWYEIGRD